MRGYIPRRVGPDVSSYLRHFPAVAIVGPRQCGKSSLAQTLLAEHPSGQYLDLENPAEAAKLADPALFFSHVKDDLVCLDEVQRRPDLFPVLRGILDRGNRAGQVLMLESASGALMRQTSESLTGRLIYVELTPLMLHEVDPAGGDDAAWRAVMVRGGFPGSFLAADDALSFVWREAFIRSVVERDLPTLGVTIPGATLRRFWQMCAHAHGQVVNKSVLGSALGISHTTIQRYIDTFCDAFLIRTLPPCYVNVKKRLIKSPKLYVRDTGILLSLLGLNSFAAAIAHSVFGALWEGMVIEHVLALLPPGWQASFYRTADGAEIDLVLERGTRRIGIECKASTAPTLTKGFWTAREDLGLDAALVVAPINDDYPLGKDVLAVSLGSLVKTHLAALVTA